mgnify:CR=1 FL=1
MIHTQFVDFEVTDDLILSTINVSHVDLEVAITSVNERLKLSQGKPGYVMVDIRNVRSTTKDAREFLNSEKASENVAAMAIVINSPVGKMLASFYISLNKPSYQSKIFVNREKAVQWLKKYETKVKQAGMD